MNENKNYLVIYVHGKSGNANEIENYHKFFSGHEFYGFDYKADNPWYPIYKRHIQQSIVFITN